jgi:hypothetical protein
VNRANLDRLITDAVAIEAQDAKEAGALGYMARTLVQATRGGRIGLDVPEYPASRMRRPIDMISAEDVDRFIPLKRPPGDRSANCAALRSAGPEVPSRPSLP